MKRTKSILIRTFITTTSIICGWASVHGSLLLYVQLFGPFYPNSAQQQRNADHYFISVFLAIIIFAFIGNFIYNRQKECRTMAEQSKMNP